MRSHEIQENDVFMEAKSRAAEVEMLSTYASADEYGTEGAVPYMAIPIDDVYKEVLEQA